MCDAVYLVTECCERKSGTAGVAAQKCILNNVGATCLFQPSCNEHEQEEIRSLMFTVKITNKKFFSKN